jgi:hypothetical protein
LGGVSSVPWAFSTEWDAGAEQVAEAAIAMMRIDRQSALKLIGHAPELSGGMVEKRLGRELKG